MIRNKRLTRYFQTTSSRSHVAIFDIGTRAVKLLLAPKEIPRQDWQQHTFYNDSMVTNLGAQLTSQQGVLNIRSPHLAKIISFILEYRLALIRQGVSPHHMTAVGTAVFRWLKNRHTVLREIQRRTGIYPLVIRDTEEATLSLASLVTTYRFRRNFSSPTDKDILVLLDQGGGSLEVSYVFSDNFNKQERFSFGELGTLALRKSFFPNSYPNLGSFVWEKKQLHQYQKMCDFIDQTIASWPGYPDVSSQQVQLYAVGSAIMQCFPHTSNFWIHNRCVTTTELEQLIDENLATPSYDPYPGRKSSSLYYWDNRWAAVLGLPVYLRMMKKFQQTKLHICGYGLRYGVYVWQYLFQRSLQEISVVDKR